MKKNRSFNIIFLPILIFGIVACGVKHTEWIKTEDGTLIWAQQKGAEYTYVWDGPSFCGVAHGTGTLAKYKGDKLISEMSVSPVYGAILQKTIIGVKGGGKYVGEFRKGKFDGFGVLSQGNDLLIGQFKHGNPDGTLQWYKKSHLYYSGEWSNGEFNGEGTLYKEDGSIEEGTWIAGKLTRTTIEADTQIGHYSGEVLNEKPEGDGVMSYANGGVYDGGWTKGKWNGPGCYTHDRDTVIADWVDGQMTGYAVYKTDNVLYEGDIENNSPDGIGYLYTSDGSLYTGGWKDGKRSGYGDMVFQNSDTYMGEWADNEFNGLGRYYYASGETYYGEWSKGLQQGMGKYESPEFTYEGHWEEGWINGEGTIEYANGDSYEGNFVENVLYGTGAYTFADGNMYEGEFVDGKFNGLGIFHFADGNRYEGEFLDGKIQGDGTLYYIDEDETVSVTANWDGSGKLPSMASILFSNGDLYEGELINGIPSENGSWTNVNDKDNKSLKDTALGKANEFYKAHRETWNKVVIYSSTALSVVEIGCGILGAIPTPASPVLLAVSAGAGILNQVINVADAAVAVASAGTDLSEAIQEGGDVIEPVTTLATEVAVNAAFIVVPKVLKSEPARKLGVKLSESAVTAVKSVSAATRKAAIQITRSKACKQIVRVATDRKNQIVKVVENANTKILNSKTGRTLIKAFNSHKNQFLFFEEYEKNMKKNPNVKLNLNSGSSSRILGENFMSVAGIKARKASDLEKKLSYARGEERATFNFHHIVAGNNNSDAAIESRKIMECCGVNINHPLNAILLPQTIESIYKGSLHSKQSDLYDVEVRNILRKWVKKNGGCSLETFAMAMDEVKRNLYNGNLRVRGVQNHDVVTVFNSFKRK